MTTETPGLSQRDLEAIERVLYKHSLSEIEDRIIARAVGSAD